MFLRYKKLRENAKEPVRAFPDDAGMDIFYCPEKAFEEINIKPGENAIIPTGIAIEIPHGYMLQVMNKGGVAAKKSLVVGAHVIDAGFSGEIFIDQHNIGKESKLINAGDKIAQIVLIPIITIILIEEQEIYVNANSESRGTGCLGSTGNR
jgi:dUTP pyrophosphatase